MKSISIKLIQVYQKLSKNHPNKCRLTPSCSNYGIIAITRFGFFKGLWLLCKRLARCANNKLKIEVDDGPQNIKGDFKWLI